MPARKSFSLKYLCYKTMAQNFDQLQDEITQLPSSLIDGMYNERNSLNFQFAHAPAKIFVHNKKREIEFNFKSNPSKIPYDCYILDRITALCKDLRCLKIVNIHSVVSADWKQLFRAIPLVEIVDLHYTSCCDSVLTTIGANCPQLRDLNVSLCPLITDVGIRSLCVDFRNFGPQNTKIERLNISHTSITKQACLIALLNLPYLKRFKCRVIHSLSDVSDMLYLLLLSDQTFETIEHFDCGKIEMLIEWRMLLSKCPNLSGIELFAELGQINFNSVMVVVNSSLGRLTRLVLENVVSVDVAAIGRLFPVLRVLKLLQNEYFSGVVSDSDDRNRPFKGLVKLEVEGSRIPELCLRMLLGNCVCLHKLVIGNCDLFSDRVFGDFVERNPLRELKEMKFQMCNSITVDSLLGILGAENPLGFLTVSNCRNIGKTEHRMMQKLVGDRAMDVKFSFA